MVHIAASRKACYPDEPVSIMCFVCPQIIIRDLNKSVNNAYSSLPCTVHTEQPGSSFPNSVFLLRIHCIFWMAKKDQRGKCHINIISVHCWFNYLSVTALLLPPSYQCLQFLTICHNMCMRESNMWLSSRRLKRLQFLLQNGVLKKSCSWMSTYVRYDLFFHLPLKHNIWFDLGCIHLMLTAHWGISQSNSNESSKRYLYARFKL